jgi:hypothetical protein
MSARTAEQRADLVRWLCCGTIVVAAHLGLAAAIIQWTDPIEAAEPSAAIVVALAPLPVAPTPMTEDIPPGPDQVQAEATPDKPVELAKQETPPEQRTAEPFPERLIRRWRLLPTHRQICSMIECVTKRGRLPVGAEYETARFHNPSWQCGGRLAGRGARAAVRDARGRVSQ